LISCLFNKGVVIILAIHLQPRASWLNPSSGLLGLQQQRDTHRSGGASVTGCVEEIGQQTLNRRSESEFSAYTRPVGPAPNIRTEEPNLGEIFSRPWAAQDAGSRRVASTSERL